MVGWCHVRHPVSLPIASDGTLVLAARFRLWSRRATGEERRDDRAEADPRRAAPFACSRNSTRVWAAGRHPLRGTDLDRRGARRARQRAGAHRASAPSTPISLVRDGVVVHGEPDRRRHRCGDARRSASPRSTARAAYSIGGEGFGVLAAAARISSTSRTFELRPRRRARSATRSSTWRSPDGTGRIVARRRDRHRRVRAAAAASSAADEPANPELPLLSHSVTLSAAADVTLDYWWSLLGLDEVEGGPARHNVVVCHVQVSVAAAAASWSARAGRRAGSGAASARRPRRGLGAGAGSAVPSSPAAG